MVDLPPDLPPVHLTFEERFEQFDHAAGLAAYAAALWLFAGRTVRTLLRSLAPGQGPHPVDRTT